MKLENSILTTLFISLCLSSTVYSQNSPKAATILTGYVSSTIGDKGDLDNIKSRTTKSQIKILGVGLVLQKTSIQEKPNKFYSSAFSEQTGEINRISNGVSFWEETLMNGIRELGGLELNDALDATIIDKYLNWKTSGASFKYVGNVSDSELILEVIEFTSNRDVTTKLYFDEISYLLIKEEGIVHSTQGNHPYVIIYRDYKPVDGIMFSFTRDIIVGPQNRKQTFLEVAHNQPISSDKFKINKN